MAKIKYTEEATPLLNEHDGYTFQPNNYGQSMFPSSRSARKRYKNQFERMQNNQKAVRRWREMSPATKQAWNDFAAAFPQPSKRDPNKFLTGYQCFIKRNSFCFLNHGINSDFMLEPELTFSDSEEITIELKSSSHVIECADLYIKNFGLLPQVGDKLLLYASVYAEYSGHFYLPVSGSAIVEQVFADSFQASINVPDTFESVTISLYLSKPVSAGISYVGTKMRYMGCFTTKKFIELQDTPSSYLGEAGKIPAVNPEEDGLIFVDPSAGGNAFNPIQVDGQPNVTADNPAEPVEFVAGDNITIETSNSPKQITFNSVGGGGFDCNDLLECSVIQNILDIISQNDNTSIPPVNFGLLYNWDVLINDLISSNSDWFVPSRAQFEEIVTILGGESVAGGPLKITGLDFWKSPNEGATNASGLNVKGSGLVSDSGSPTGLKVNAYIGTSSLNVFGTQYYRWKLYYNLPYCNDNYTPFDTCSSIMLFKNANGKPQGASGLYIGNNGRAYRTKVLGNYEIMADFLCETKFKDGSLIPIMPDRTTFLNTTGPKAAAPEYNSDNI
ncbi:MAG: hypothetical protein SVR94_03000 [Pseudomonadota bacterium]|nr:hypothetical protein [Pseudomonadota bacterium]